MRKRYIVAVGSNEKTKNQKFTEYFDKNDLYWWHWIDNNWLIVDDDGKLSASTIRDDMMEIYENNSILVFEITGSEDTWSGYGPSSEKRDMFKWMNSDWK